MFNEACKSGVRLYLVNKIVDGQRRCNDGERLIK